MKRWEDFLNRLYSQVILPDNSTGDGIAVAIFSVVMIYLLAE